MENKRELALQAWCEAITGHHQQKIQPVSGDASFRRYFRVTDGVRSLIAVDAPPPQESLDAFIAVASAYAEQQLQVPEVLAADHEYGFMLLSDLGSTLLLGELNQASMASWYQRSLHDLMKVMKVTRTEQAELPNYDEALLRRELALFHDWLVHTHLQLEVSAHEQTVWKEFCDTLVTNALEQPQVGVHRDYHARNIMIQADESLAYIDFQDAVVGPITYDAVSLLRDCYVRWPDHQVQELSAWFHNVLVEHGLLEATVELEQWQRWFDLMGLQRHTKAAGIFARLCHRDGKRAYLQDVPRTLGYLHDIAGKYPEFADYQQWLANKVQPAMAKVTA